MEGRGQKEEEMEAKREVMWCHGSLLLCVPKRHLVCLAVPSTLSRVTQNWGQRTLVR